MCSEYFIPISHTVHITNMYFRTFGRRSLVPHQSFMMSQLSEPTFKQDVFDAVPPIESVLVVY